MTEREQRRHDRLVRRRQRHKRQRARLLEGTKVGKMMTVIERLKAEGVAVKFGLRD